MKSEGSKFTRTNANVVTSYIINSNTFSKTFLYLTDVVEEKPKEAEEKKILFFYFPCTIHKTQDWIIPTTVNKLCFLFFLFLIIKTKVETNTYYTLTLSLTFKYLTKEGREYINLVKK